MPSFLEKHSSAIKYWGNWGFAGLICGWLFMAELPAIRKDFRDREDKQYDRDEKRTTAAVAHGDRAIDSISERLEKVAAAVDRQTATFVEIQTVTHRNQQKIIELNEKMSK